MISTFDTLASLTQVLWFVAGVAALKVNPAPRPPITTETHDVTYTKRTGEDGTAVVTETVVKGEPVPVEEAVQSNVGISKRSW